MLVLRLVKTITILVLTNQVTVLQAGARIFQSNGTWSDGDYAPDDPLVHGHPREMDLTVMIVILALTGGLSLILLTACYGYLRVKRKQIQEEEETSKSIAAAKQKIIESTPIDEYVLANTDEGAGSTSGLTKFLLKQSIENEEEESVEQGKTVASTSGENNIQHDNNLQTVYSVEPSDTMTTAL